ncbi:hypothetical protein M413DRAFT_24146 [Hebeloma cylindrosporum]|uniref:INO80 complex subunit F domain-containing protein n=1 Tax=Hebeloma cylindrosporum TaxID=76867 RepID=A0A0C2Y992_HEBCY|nr:hypothetical protein M413DRAFT_24146 [Hebeloma cylindrosporum h7]
MSSPAPPLPLLTVPPRQKLQKSAPVGIAAGAEDAKYHAKYKELKRKVKDIEADNDKLHFKVLQAKLSIRRTKMERAVLYERLSVVPPSPNLQDRLALPSNAGPPHPRPLVRDHHPMDNNSVQTSSVALNSPRRISAPGPHHHPYPPPQQQQHLPTMGQIPPLHHHHSYDRLPSHASPPVHHASTSQSRTRSHSSSRSRSHHHHHHHHHQPPPQQYPQGSQQHHYPESLPPVQQPLHSPPLSERERPRRGEPQQLYPHDYLGGSSHADPHHPHPSAGGTGPYDYEQQRHPGSSSNSTTHHLHSHDSPRASSRIHAHQRLGPGTYVNSRDEYSRGHHEGGARVLIAREREHDMMLERERERELERDPRDIDRDYRDRDQDRRYNRSSRELSLHPGATQHSPPHSSSSHSHHHITSHQHRYSDRSGAQLDYAHDYPHGHGHTSSSSRSRGGGGDREEPPYRDYRDKTPTLTHAPYPQPPTRLSRSGTPGSGSVASGSGGAPPPVEGPSRPASRSQYYGDSREREYPSSATRSAYNRQVRSGGRGGEDDADFDADGHAGEGRSSRGDQPTAAAASAVGPPTPSGGNNNSNDHSAASVPATSATGNNFPMSESRKRSRNDMEVESDNDVDGQQPLSAGERGAKLYGSRPQQDDSRGSKRYHREHRRSVDNISTHEDTRMGP